MTRPVARESSSAAPRSVHGDDTWVERPVLLYGARKSGTTLLASLVDGAPGLLAYPNEVKLKRFAERIWTSRDHMVADYLANVTDPLKSPLRSPMAAPGPSRQAIPGSERVDWSRARVDTSVAVGSLDASHGARRFDVDAYVASLRGLAESPPSSLRELLVRDIRCFRDALRPPPDGLSAWAMKEVGGDPARVIGFFKTMFPNGPVIVIVRHPLWVVRSIIHDRRRRGVRMTRRDVVRQVVIALRQVERYHALVASGVAHFVVYEDLTSGKLTNAMRGVAAHLGLPYTDAYERPTTLGDSVIVRTSSRREASVFSQDATDWYDGLSLSERALATVAATVYRRHADLSYQRLLQRIQSE